MEVTTRTAYGAMTTGISITPMEPDWFGVQSRRAAGGHKLTG